MMDKETKRFVEFEDNGGNNQMKVISKENGNYVIREQQEESILVTIAKGVIMLGTLVYTFMALGGI